MLGKRNFILTKYSASYVTKYRKALMTNDRFVIISAFAFLIIKVVVADRKCVGSVFGDPIIRSDPRIHKE